MFAHRWTPTTRRPTLRMRPRRTCSVCGQMADDDLNDDHIAHRFLYSISDLLLRLNVGERVDHDEPIGVSDGVDGVSSRAMACAPRARRAAFRSFVMQSIAALVGWLG